MVPHTPLGSVEPWKSCRAWDHTLRLEVSSLGPHTTLGSVEPGTTHSACWGNIGILCFIQRGIEVVHRRVRAEI